MRRPGVGRLPAAVLPAVLVAACLALNAAAPDPARPEHNPAARGTLREFTVYDSLGYQRKPNTAKLGMTPILCTGDAFWSRGVGGKEDRSKPDRPACKRIARRAWATGRPLVINIEHWPVDVRAAKAEEVDASVRKLLQMVQWMREERPGLSIGFFGLTVADGYYPICNHVNAMLKPEQEPYRANLAKFRKEYQDWRRATAALAPLAEASDVIYLPLYAPGVDRDNWSRFAHHAVAEARRWRKPVVAFLWPRQVNPNPETGRHDALPGGFWRVMLEHARTLCDGALLWDAGPWRAFGTGPALNQNEEWWPETLDFMRALR